MKQTTIFLLLGLAVFALFAFTYKNTDVPKSDSRLAKGIVNVIKEGGAQDVVFELEGKQQSFYINRGVEYGFDIHALEKEMLAEEVVIYYADEWSLFAPFGSNAKPIREIICDNRVVYSEY